MKRFPLLLPLVAVVFAVACTDSTAPASSHALLAPANPSFAVGNPPPPPVDAAVVVCVGGVCTVVDGRYNAKTPGGGGFAPIVPGGFAPVLADDPEMDDLGQTSGVCTFGGKAWLKFDKLKRRKHHEDEDFKTTGRARINCRDFEASGKGTLRYQTGGHKVVVFLEQVRTFNNTQDCQTFCADFTANATLDGEPSTATGDAFNRSYYDDVCEGFEGDVCIPEHGGC